MSPGASSIIIFIIYKHARRMCVELVPYYDRSDTRSHSLLHIPPVSFSPSFKVKVKACILCSVPPPSRRMLQERCKYTYDASLMCPVPGLNDRASHVNLSPFLRTIAACLSRQPTRSLGDAYLKYPEFNGQEGTHKSAGRFMPPPYTPPYITAEPEVR